MYMRECAPQFTRHAMQRLCLWLTVTVVVYGLAELCWPSPAWLLLFVPLALLLTWWWWPALLRWTLPMEPVDRDDDPVWREFCRQTDRRLQQLEAALPEAAAPTGDDIDMLAEVTPWNHATELGSFGELHAWAASQPASLSPGRRDQVRWAVQYIRYLRQQLGVR